MILIYCIIWGKYRKFKTNKIFKEEESIKVIKRFLLSEDEFMPEMHLRQPRFIFSVCRLFSKNNERIQTFKETGD